VYAELDQALPFIAQVEARAEEANSAIIENQRQDADYDAAELEAEASARYHDLVGVVTSSDAGMRGVMMVRPLLLRACMRVNNCRRFYHTTVN
jgi:hypothetical protein